MNDTLTRRGRGLWPLALLIAAVLGMVAALPAEALAAEAVSVWRLYNPHDGQHLLTTDLNEYRTLQVNGWRGEGNGFDAPSSGDVAIYRLYNPSNGDHLYTAEAAERAALLADGWRDEGPAFYDAGASGDVAVYRLWNRWQTAGGGAGSHLWTTDENEYGTLPAQSGGAWVQERLVWHGLAADADGLPRPLSNPATDVCDTEPTFLLTHVTLIRDNSVRRDRMEWDYEYDDRGNLTRSKHSTFSYDDGNNLVGKETSWDGSSSSSTTFSTPELAERDGGITYSQRNDASYGWEGTERFVLDPATYALRKVIYDYHYETNHGNPGSDSRDTYEFGGDGVWDGIHEYLDGTDIRYDANGCVSSVSYTGLGNVRHCEYTYEPSYTCTYLNRARAVARMNLFHAATSGYEFIEPPSLAMSGEYEATYGID